MKLEAVIAAKKAKLPKSKKLVVVENVTPLPKQKKKNKKNRRPNRNGSQAGLSSAMEECLLFPDLVGPVRFPVLGSDARCTIGMDRVRVQMNGSGTNTAQLLVLSAAIQGSCALNYSSSNASTSWAANANTFPAVSWPGGTSISDGRITSAGLVVTYTGNILNCSGECIIGTLPDAAVSSLNATTYNSLQYLPGVIRVPIASLVENPLRVALRHAAPQSWDLTVSGGNAVDVELPFFATLNLPSGQGISIEVVKNYEVRTTITADLVPYSSSSAGRASDDAAMTNAQSRLASRSNMVTPMMPNTGGGSYVGEVLGELFTNTSRMIGQNLASKSGVIIDSAIDVGLQYARSRVNRFIHEPRRNQIQY